jgi:heterodisulfide reductase subunit C
MAEAKKAFNNKQWEDGLRLDRCKYCGTCRLRCPNHLEVVEIIKDAQRVMYDKAG